MLMFMHSVKSLALGIYPVSGSDHGVVLVVEVVGVAGHAVGAELELEELMPELALVPPRSSAGRTRRRCHSTIERRKCR